MKVEDLADGDDFITAGNTYKVINVNQRNFCISRRNGKNMSKYRVVLCLETFSLGILRKDLDVEKL